MNQSPRILVLLALILINAAPSLADEKKAKTGTYQPDWKSLDARPIPSWYTEARFGIFIHWGVYSVPAWGPKGKYAEWYWHDLQDKKGPTWQFHQRVYGEKFPYADFAPLFRAEMFDPKQWADLLARSGAKYVVLTSKHHEGFCLWPSAEANRSWGRPWNSVDLGPHRDLLGDLGKAVRARGLKMGFYYSLYEWFNPLYRTDFPRFRDQHFFPQFKDVVTRYKPAIIFADGEWEHTSAEWHSPDLLAWLYNEGGCGADLVVNDRWGKDTRGKHGGYYTTEYGGMTGFKIGPSHAWEESRGLGASYGYNRNEDYADYHSASQLIRLLVEMSSQGGNLLLDIGPTGDGRIPVIMQERLLEMGQWLKANGESIYGTSAGPIPPPTWGRCTARTGKLYLHVFEWPKDGKLNIAGIKGPVKNAYLLADGKHTPLKVSKTGETVQLDVPGNAPDPIDTVIVVED